MHELHLNIFNSCFKVICENGELNRLLSLDFEYFQKEIGLNLSVNKVEVFLKKAPLELIPKEVALSQNETSIIYESNNQRINDYHGKALTIVNYADNQAKIYCEDINLAHELSYLYILSRSGKAMDLNGFHKNHAMAVKYQGHNIILMIPSKGGKSTQFLSLLEDPSIEVFSDDTPVISRLGEIYPFPLRVGIEEGAQIPSFVDQEKVYYLTRRNHGKKTLIPLMGMERKIASSGGKNILIVGKRSNKNEPSVQAILKIKMFHHLIHNMVIGIGLPMILEYFLETGINDFFRKVKIILSRTVAATFLLMRSDCYELEMTSDIAKNTELMKNLCNSGKVD